jgi:hypothetical protein
MQVIERYLVGPNYEHRTADFEEILARMHECAAVWWDRDYDPLGFGEGHLIVARCWTGINDAWGHGIVILFRPGHALDVSMEMISLKGGVDYDRWILRTWKDGFVGWRRKYLDG